MEETPKENSDTVILKWLEKNGAQLMILLIIIGLLIPLFMYFRMKDMPKEHKGKTLIEANIPKQP
ncbi:MAG: hypothetical protein V1682_02600 [Candidatus Omnitrophota bacterium]